MAKQIVIALCDRFSRFSGGLYTEIRAVMVECVDFETQQQLVAAQQFLTFSVSFPINISIHDTEILEIDPILPYLFRRLRHAPSVRALFIIEP